MAATGKYRLYGRQGSGSLAVQVALEAAGAPYERVWVGRESGDVERFRAINPTGRVPALALPDGTLMFESAAILIHLAAIHPQAALAPPVGSSPHARFLQWMVFLSANVYESALRVYYPARYSARGDLDADAIRTSATADLCTHLAVVERDLAPYVMGVDYSIADAYLYMLAGWFPGEKSDLWKRLPKLEVHAQRVGARPEVARVDADHAQA